MNDLEQKIMKRINVIDLDILCDSIDKLKKYNIKFYNNKGEFNFDKFRKDCRKIIRILVDKEEPINGIRYRFCDCLSAIQKLVGKRNVIDFMNENA